MKAQIQTYGGAGGGQHAVVVDVQDVRIDGDPPESTRYVGNVFPAVRRSR
jgi:hypothetical protein